MNQNKLIQLISIAVIIIVALIFSYLLFSPNAATKNSSGNELAPIVDGKQALNMTVLAVDYSPNFFKVKAGIPIRWEITSSGQPGCASGMIIASGLVDPIYLNPQQGEVKIVEFTAQAPGTYKFNCSMNMARGTIQVVDYLELRNAR